MKKLTEFESLEDFGFRASVNEQGKVEFIKCDADFEKTVTTGDPNFVYANGDLTTGKFFTLGDILSGGTLTVDVGDSVLGDQASLSLDFNLPTSLAYLGSVYSTAIIGINDIKENYPNGYELTAILTGVNTAMFNYDDVYFYGSDPFAIVSFVDYEFIQASGGTYHSTFQIDADISITGGTYALVFLDGTPNTGGDYTHMIQPKTSALDKFYAGINSYQLDLLVPPVTRSNYYPRAVDAFNNILFEGSRYDTFIETELAWATDSDQEDSNFIWRKLYPDGQKNLDSDDGLMQKMILSIAANFDAIKRYQDQLKYQQHIAYETSDHISKDLVELLAYQWNWGIGHNLNQDDYSEHIYSQYDNYITGLSEQKLSAKDVNFEIWRRVLANIVTLYKKKGTEEAIKYVTNIYGLPEALLWIEELVEANNRGTNELVESEGNVTVRLGGLTYYIDELGSATTLSYHMVKNTKYLNINISPFDAIEFDFYDWGWENHPDIIDVYGNSVALSSSTEITKLDFFKRIYNATIKSDGSARYDERYPVLEKEAEYYYDNSVNKMTLATLEPYMDFLDDNWNILITDLVPASSRLLSIGNLYRNPMWHRQKHQWISEIDGVDLPFNETIEINLPNPDISLNTSTLVLIDIEDLTGSAKLTNDAIISPPQILGEEQLNTSTEIEGVVEVGSISTNHYGTIEKDDPSIVLISDPEDIQILEYEYSANTYIINSPLLTPISGQYGTLDYIDYSTDALVVSNENRFDVIFSAYNLSDSGYTQLKFELFQREYDNGIIIDEEKEYSIMSVEYEGPMWGVYKVSSLENIETFDFIKIESDYLPFINESVQVNYIDTGTSTMRTYPPIGLFNLPTGQENNIVDWVDFVQIGSIDMLRLIKQLSDLTDAEIIKALKAIANYVDGGNLIDVQQLSSILYGFGLQSHEISLFEWWWNQEPGIIYGAILIMEFTKGNSSWTLNSPEQQLVQMTISDQVKAKFKRIINFFNWSFPQQEITYANYLIDGGDFSFPIIDTEQRSEDNDYSMTGTVTFGGLNYLNANILQDKEEYFMRYKASTHAPKSWGNVDGMIIFPVQDSGGTIIDSGYDLNYLNNIKYYGRYFMYMDTPNVPIANVEGLDSEQVANDASITAKWNGVGDSDRLELQYFVTGGTPINGTYSNITSVDWETGSTTINIPARDGVGDEYIYTIQTTLEPDTYYWWRVKNFRNKINIFGHNLEYYTTTEPGWFKTGEFEDSGANEGEIPNSPVLPIDPINRGGDSIPDI